MQDTRRIVKGAIIGALIAAVYSTFVFLVCNSNFNFQSSYFLIVCGLGVGWSYFYLLPIAALILFVLNIFTTVRLASVDLYLVFSILNILVGAVVGAIYGRFARGGISSAFLLRVLVCCFLLLLAVLGLGMILF